MQVGVVFPQTEIGAEPGPVREYALAAEAAGYEHLLAYDHVLGAERERPGGFNGPYDSETLFHEPLVLFGYLAGLTERMQLVTGILILPQRQTALVAKQAAEVDVLSGGRLILGVGVGWNRVEYESLGEDFGTRGRRMEEQVTLLRSLWANQSISFEGRYHSVVRAGIKPLPPKRSIPVWMGGMSDVVRTRVGRMADGWFPQFRDPAELAEGLKPVHEAAQAAGRDPASIAIGCSVTLDDIDGAVERARAFGEGGATHISVNTMRLGFDTVGQHIQAIERFKAAFGE